MVCTLEPLKALIGRDTLLRNQIISQLFAATHGTKISLVISEEKVFHCNHMCQQENLQPWSPVGM